MAAGRIRVRSAVPDDVRLLAGLRCGFGIGLGRAVIGFGFIPAISLRIAAQRFALRHGHLAIRIGLGDGHIIGIPSRRIGAATTLA